MWLKPLKSLIFALFMLGTVFITSAQANSGGEGGNSQSPVQVLVQIVLTTALIKLLARFNLP